MWLRLTERLLCSRHMAVFLQKDETFADRVAEMCYGHYENLGRKGKPQSGREWALVAAVVCVDEKETADTPFIVSMGTGSKCLGQSKMSPQGNVLNDSHAEVIARRGFLRYLYKQLEYAYTGKPSCFVYKEGNRLCKLTEEISFHLFTSHTPCGDASIFPKMDDDDTIVLETPSDTKHDICGNAKDDINKPTEDLRSTESIEPPAKKRCTMEISHQQNKPTQPVITTCKDPLDEFQEGGRRNSEEFAKGQLDHHHSMSSAFEQPGTYSEYCASSSSCLESWSSQTYKQEDRKTTEDIYRTGAKCVPGGEQDLFRSGTGYHAVGVLRTKPGRGDPTLSMSCSDKILKWNILGCQGALLSYFLASPIYLSSVIIGKCPFDLVAVERAFYRCAELPAISTFTVGKPRIFISQKEFEFSKAKLQSDMVTSEGSGKISPSSTAIIWIKDPLLHEVSVNGIKQGVTKANLTTPKARVCICKSSLFDTFKSLVSTIPVEKLPLPLRQGEMMTYTEFKGGALKYSAARQQFLASFPTWMLKPSWLANFT